MGKFQGAIIPQTPTGMRTDMANLSRNSDGVVWPKSLPPFPRHVEGGVGRFLHIAPRFAQDLAHFTRHLPGQLFLMPLQQQLTGAVKHLAALGCRIQPPLAMIGCPAALTARSTSTSAGGLKLSYDIVDIGGVVIEKSLAASRHSPIAANQVLVDLRRHRTFPFVELQRITQANRRCCSA